MTHDTTTGAAWAPLIAALDAAADDPAPRRFWLRDDDAVTVTPALERLGALCAAQGAPLLLAAIPAGAEPPLRRWTAARPLLTVCQHGHSHRNHAGPGERACEMGGAREDAAVLADLAAGQRAMSRIFHEGWTPLLVPPWNRIRPSLLPQLQPAGFTALSTFAGSAVANNTALPTLDCDLDIIDWRNGRVGRDVATLARRLAGLIADARGSGRPIGLLTHHLVHDERAWAFLDGVIPLLARHPAARWTSAVAELRGD